MVEMQCLLNNYKMPLQQQRVKEPDSNGVGFMRNRGNRLDH
jgi:hypothetical protein